MNDLIGKISNWIMEDKTEPLQQASDLFKKWLPIYRFLIEKGWNDIAALFTSLAISCAIVAATIIAPIIIWNII